MTLALDWRPRRFADIVGQRGTRVVLQAMVRSGDLPTALLFTGPRGTGKTSTARILAAALNCLQRNDKGEPCTTCASCAAIAKGSSPDVLEVDAASNGVVANIRDLRDVVQYAVGGDWRVVMLDECHSLTREASNALLKTLEEPPPRTIFVLLTTEEGKILDTVFSRCMKFEFRRISAHDIYQRLVAIANAEGFGRDDEAYTDLLAVIADRANGGLRDAVMTLDHVRRVGVKTVTEFRVLVGESDFGPELLTRLLNGDYPRVFGLVDEVLTRTGDTDVVATALVGVMRDVLVLSAGGDLGRSGEHLDARRALCDRVEPARIVAAMRVLWDHRTRIRRSDDARASLDLALVLVSQALGSSGAVMTPAVVAPVRLNLTEMKDRAK